MAVEKPELPVFCYKFQGILNANVFSELAVHTGSKMITFTNGLHAARVFFCSTLYSVCAVTQL